MASCVAKGWKIYTVQKAEQQDLCIEVDHKPIDETVNQPITPTAIMKHQLSHPSIWGMDLGIWWVLTSAFSK